MKNVIILSFSYLPYYLIAVLIFIRAKNQEYIFKGATPISAIIPFLYLILYYLSISNLTIYEIVKGIINALFLYILLALPSTRIFSSSTIPLAKRLLSILLASMIMFLVFAIFFYLNGESTSLLGSAPIFFLVLARSIFEEVLFRGFIFDDLILRTHSPYLTIFSTSLIFSIAHLTIDPNISIRLTYIFILGLVLGLLRLKTDLVSSIFAHILYNLMVLSIPGLIFINR